MIEILIKLIEEFIKLRQHGNSINKIYLEQFVKPTYDSAEIIYRNYRSILTDSKNKIKRCKTLPPITRLIEDRRNEYWPLRQKLRSSINQQEHMTIFELGVLGLLSGSISSYGERYFNTYPLDSTERGRILKAEVGHHTLLTLISFIKGGDSNDLNNSRETLLKAVDMQLEGIDQAWKTICEGYSMIYKDVYELTPPKKFRVKAQKMRIGQPINKENE